MANEPDPPSQLYRVLNERLQNSDKEGAIEVYYELLSAGRSVGEILNGVDPSLRNPGYDAGAAQADAPCSGGLIVRDEATGCGTDRPDGTRSAPPHPLGSDGGPLSNGERRLSDNLAESDPDIVSPAGAHFSNGWEAAVPADNRERLWSGNFLGIAKSVAFWALYTGMIASASIAGFSMLHRDRAAEPTTARVTPNASGGNGTVAAAFAAGGTPGSTIARAAVDAPGLQSEKQLAGAGASQVQPSRPGEPVADVLGPLRPVAAGVQETASAAGEAAAPAQSDAGHSDAIGQLIEHVSDPAEAPHGSVREITGQPAPAPSVIPAGAAEAAPHPGAGQPAAGVKPDAAPRDEAKATATVPSGTVSAALPSEAHAAKTGRAGTPHRHAAARHSSSRRVSNRPQLSQAGHAPGPYPGDPAAGSYYADFGQRYDGAYGPSPNADTGN